MPLFVIWGARFMHGVKRGGGHVSCMESTLCIEQGTESHRRSTAAPRASASAFNLQQRLRFGRVDGFEHPALIWTQAHRLFGHGIGPTPTAY